MHFVPPFRDLEATYTVHSRFIGKRIVDFLFVFTELFQGVTVEAPQANIG